MKPPWLKGLSGRRILVIAWLLLPALTGSGAAVFDVRHYGATGDGTHLDTSALQQAIDAAAAAGGGTVRLPAGHYLSGSLDLKSHVALQLDAAATLLGSPQPVDYEPGKFRGLLVADHQQDIAVVGPGVIDGQGTALAHAAGARRSKLIDFGNCTNVTVRDITLKNSAEWVEDYHDCDHLELEHITVRSLAAMNNDGMDIDGCAQVEVRGCDIDSEDDGICLKSKDRACTDVLVENCRVRSSCNAFKLGTESAGGFKNITISNLSIYDTYISGIALETVDGGALENVRISQVKITGTHNPIFIRLGHRDVNGPAGAIHGVFLGDIEAEIPRVPPFPMEKFPGPDPYHTPTLITASITGLPDNPVREVTLKNIHIVYGGIGGGSPMNRLRWQDPGRVPERAPHYPESKMFGTLPAWGFYCRHVRGLTFDNVTLDLQSEDYRPALICDDVREMKLDGLHVGAAGSAPVIVLNNVHGAVIHDSPPPAGAAPFIKMMGGADNVQQP